MRNKRLMIALTWSALSVLEIILFLSGLTSNYIFHFILGFHFPMDSFLWIVYSGMFDFYPEYSLLILLVCFLFVIIWIISIINIKKNKLFEGVFVADILMSFVMHTLSWIAPGNYFVHWIWIIVLIVEIVVCIILFITKKIR